MIGIDHDLRFYDIYGTSVGIVDWVSQRTGYWLSQKHAIGLQHGLLACLSGLAGAVVLRGSSTWDRKWRFRATLGLAGLVLPWLVLVHDLDRFPRYPPAGWTLFIGYCALCTMGVAASCSVGMRRALVGLAATCAALLLYWQIEWIPFTVGSLATSLVLLGSAFLRSGSRDSVFG